MNVFITVLISVCFALQHMRLTDGKREETLAPPYPTHRTGQAGTSSGGNLTPTQIGEKKYSLGIFFKANWLRAGQYCRYHNMQLASILSEQEELLLENALDSLGFTLGPVWTSGTDISFEGKYVWKSNGFPIDYVKWFGRKPNGQTSENCLAVEYSDDEYGYGWDDEDCQEQFYFVCEFFTHNYTKPVVSSDNHPYIRF